MAVFYGPDDSNEDRESRTESAPPASGVDARFWWFAVQYFRRNRGRVLGVIVGLWLGFGIMKLGVLWTLFISASVAIGYLIGRRLDDNQENLLDFLDRVLPPGRG